MIHTWHIHINGQVQGVGFRPFVYRQAIEHRLNGWVNNSADGVHIEINAPEAGAQSFYQAVIEQAPALSHITTHHLQQAEDAFFDTFAIRRSDAGDGPPNLLLTPDFAMCSACRREVINHGHRRTNYAFTTCTYCGPRYSIIQRLPYDRETTTMAPFTMCRECSAEYSDPLDRRYYAQTNSCPACPVEMALHDRDGSLICSDTNEILEAVCRLWDAGKIVAIKGIGGYLATCDAANRPAIRELRRRKHRPTKPFALMYGSTEALSEAVDISEAEVSALTSPQAPIVLLNATRHMREAIAFDDIAPGLQQAGVILPYTPLFALLMHTYMKPVVATSGNISNAPIIYDDARAPGELPAIADAILTNNRTIVIPQDDSVVKFTPLHRKRIIIRRSRGMAPTCITDSLSWPEATILCMGAMLKSTFTFLHRGNTYVSQYLGDLASHGTQMNYQHTIGHFLQLFDARPERIVVDKHPEYPSTRYGEKLAEDFGVPCTSVQHHLAHFAAVLAEHDRLRTVTPILGVIWDGTGLGDDGHIWGGECFIYREQAFSRHVHLAYFSHILGDKMPREPRISALSALYGTDGEVGLLESKFNPTEWKLYNDLLARGGGLQTSSMGRLFDAVASILGVMDIQTYEGEAAMRLEALASGYLRKNGLHGLTSYLTGLPEDNLPTRTILTGVVHDLQKGLVRERIAAKFHYTLVLAIRDIATAAGIPTITFSGGVFQNSVLVDMLIGELGDTFELLFHKQLSPNDEGVSFGQMVLEAVDL